ncbi:hypothetical protein C5L33_001329 [Lactobacillus pasteurii]|uniref:Uncharacterized protein n=1 Tax=Lactobacillus pasteurii DSM 23907 = CRBIP 24.76 TaxID=1423790 RepID=I7IZV4_9LACO|nr:hypothetical protein C5L33_001329 [Lactobacillus pasteurii]CCI85337.1 Protein of unknown function [Lactobacillus pasteurii DSM 23907 = CRBIP 24.76]
MNKNEVEKFTKNLERKLLFSNAFYVVVGTIVTITWLSAFVLAVWACLHFIFKLF